MSSDIDKCFQCQETGHMACYFPHIRCCDCNNYGHVTADCSNKIPPSGTPARCRDNNTSRHDRQILGVIITPGITTMTIGIDTDSVDLDLTHITLGIGVTATVILTEVTLDPFTSPHAVAHHATEAQAHTVLLRHTTPQDPHHTEISPEMTVDPGHTNSTNTITKPHKDHLPVHNQTPWKPKDRKYKQVTIDDSPSEYYSSDEQAIDSEDDLN